MVISDLSFKKFYFEVEQVKSNECISVYLKNAGG